MMGKFSSHQWAVILGGSSGFGLATAKKLSREGMSVCIVHRDRKGSMPRIEPDFEAIRKSGHGFLAVNTDALSEAGCAEVIDALRSALGSEGRVRLLMHSIALGNLKPLAPARAGGPALEDEDFSQTIYAMGSSIFTWVRALLDRKMFAADARVLGMTSEGNEIAWPGYAAVSAAKAVLESISRSMAVELAPFGIRSNVLQAGVTDTPALKLIPGSAAMMATAQERNPFGRLTTPGDVANVIALLCTDEAAWINGALLRVDGGEAITAHLEKAGG